MTLRSTRLQAALAILLAAFLTGCASTAAPLEDRHPDDPWEPFNRSVYAFNSGVDKAVLRPVAQGYVRVTPEPARSGIGNFFRNLKSPVIFLNLLLQGEFSDMEDEFQRFFVNTVYGVGGLFDVASAGDIEKHDADFGQTLATWGWHDSRFVMLPFLGPSTVRDTVGRGADTLPDETWRLAVNQGAVGLLALNIVHMRAGLLPLDRELAEAYDEYALVRDGWMQRRNHFIHGEQAQTPDYDAWLEDDDWDDDW